MTTINSGGGFTCLPPNAEQEVFESSRPLRVKFGIDPTLDRLHLGHFVPLRLARKLQEQGHKLDLILGTMTGRLGDPSGQDKTRPILTDEQVRTNADRLLTQVEQVLLPDFKVHLNHEFVDAMDVPFFLTRLCSKVTVANMLSRDGFRKRNDEGKPIALHEFLVPLIQGWDSVVVKSEVEIGGTDQLFNFQIARQLQESEGQEPQRCLMTPVIRGTDGRKMSKSFDNAIWLDENPADMFGNIMSVSDEVADEWIGLLTDLDVLSDHPMERKKSLAHDIVRQLHNQDAANEAQAFFESTVQRKELPAELPVVEQNTLFLLVSEARSESRSNARKLILGGGVKIDGEKVIDPLCEPHVGAVVQIGRRVAVVVR
jgi:tyrosyl-tRNA synthetase